jgi:hypothetical protein
LNSSEFRHHLQQLGLTQAEAAELLSVALRTVRRWADETNGEIPGPAAEALRAWLALHRQGIPWKPGCPDDTQIARYRAHAVELHALLQRVARRGGPAAPWKVDLERSRATLGPIQLTFYTLANGGFSPGYYSRSDGNTNLKRDWPLIEDAFACIAQAFKDREGAPFIFAVSLQNAFVLLWDVQKVPTTVVKIACSAIRSALTKREPISDEQCRLLIESNKEVVGELAHALYAANRYVVRDDGITLIEILEADLASVLARFSLGVLEATLYWVQS